MHTEAILLQWSHWLGKSVCHCNLESSIESEKIFFWNLLIFQHNNKQRSWKFGCLQFSEKLWKSVIPLTLIRFTFFLLFSNGTCSGVITWPKYRLKHGLYITLETLTVNIFKLCFKCLVICVSPRSRDRIRETRTFKQINYELRPNSIR